MDPPLDLDSDERRSHLEVSLRKVVESQIPSKYQSTDSRFVKRVEILEVKLLATTSKYKESVLYEKFLVIHFTGLWPSPRSIEIWLNKN